MKPRAFGLWPLVVVLLVACGGSNDEAPPAPAPAPQPPPVTPGVPIPPGQIEHAIGQLDRLGNDILARTQVPGMAVAVVHQGQLAYLRGFGVREVGQPAPVDADTVFQLASLSKPVGATVVARQVAQQQVRWDTPMTEALPGFALADPGITQQLTVGDLYAHRSGLPDHAGDDLEDIGYDRDTILQRLRYLALAPFRDTYAYTNFGLTAAAQGVARQSGTDWATLSERNLYRPLGMDHTSSRFADYLARPNRAVPHMWIDGRYQALAQRDPDAQSPAGGASSTARDMARWMQLILAEGRHQGQPWITAEALLPAITPQVVSDRPNRPDARAGTYGFGFGVGVQPSGRTVLSHSGAFLLGAATTVMMLPSADVGIVVLTNAQPRGAPEALAQTFLDLVQFGAPQRDWLSAYANVLAPMMRPFGRYAEATPPPAPQPSAALATLVGTYHNPYVGAAGVSLTGDTLWLTLGPAGLRWPLRHWDGNTFVYALANENAPPGSLAAVTFGADAGGRITTVDLEVFEAAGQARLVRQP